MTRKYFLYHLCVVGAFLGSAGTLISLTGCNSYKDAADWSDVQSPKTNKVERASTPYILSFDSVHPALNTTSAQVLNELIQLKASKRSVYWRVFIAESTKGGMLLDKGKSIRTVLKQAGVADKRVSLNVLEEKNFKVLCSHYKHLPPTDSFIKNAALLIVDQYIVIPPRCPDWSKGLGDADTTEAMRNFRCGTATNFGAMISDPRDLLGDSQVAFEEGINAAQDVENYRHDKVKAIRIESTKSMQ